MGDIEGGPAINLDGDANLREWPDDFPGSCPASSGLTNIACTGSFPARGWHDWTYGATQCTFLTGAILADCIGTTGRLGAFTGLAWETLTIKWKMLTSHHSAGSNSQYNDKTMYGRGGMGNVQQICDTSAEIENDGAQCTVDSDCHNVNGTIVGAVLNTDCGSGTNPDMTGTLAGNVQATLQAQAETFRIASGGNSFFLYGHDHLSTCAQKYKAGPTATGVYYCTGTQPGYEQSGPNWTDNPILVTSYDWGGKTNGSDQRADYCTLPSRTAFIEGEQNEAACNGLDSASPSSGSVLRGYIDMRVNGTTNVTMTQYSSILDSEPLLLAIEPNNTAEWTMTAP